MASAFMIKSAAIARSAVASSPAPLRVALFSGNYNYVMDGPVRALNKLVAHLEARGHQALIFAPTAKEAALEHAGELISVPSVALPGSRSEYRFGFGLDAAAQRRLSLFAPTIVHVAAPDWLGFTALNYARRRGLPAVASFHTRFDTYPRYYGMAWLEKHVTSYLRYFYGRCERVYAPSQSMVDELTRDGIGRDIRLWARGVDHCQFNPERRDLHWREELGVSGDDILVAFVGRIVREKGIDVFASALKAARAEIPKIRGLIVGDGPDRERFNALLPDDHFIGYQQGEALARAYASADIFFNPSVTETFGNVTLEAMASGLPCVCAAASGSRSLVDDGVTGKLIADAKDARGFADAIQSLAGDQAHRMHMAENARAKSVSFQWDVILDRLITDYQDVVSGHEA
jgi:glycosyltransferase involved in cell wall biosynthesis